MSAERGCHDSESPMPDELQDGTLSANRGSNGWKHKLTTSTFRRQGVRCTVEVGGLQTLRLESLKLIFQPIHKFLVKKLLFWQVG
jgi:hypothetical protein